MREKIIQRILDKKLIAIIRGIDAGKCLDLTRAIFAGGIDMVEVTFDQSKPDSFASTTSVIAAIDREFGGQVFVGAGTVLNPQQVKLAAEAGAKYIISPDTQEDVIKATRELGLVSIPGGMTPTDITVAHRAGADFVKLFPAGSLGPGYMKAVCAPLSHIPLLAVGGVDAANIPDFLAAGCKGFGVGGNLVNKSWIEAGEFAKITEAARALCRAVNG